MDLVGHVEAEVQRHLAAGEDPDAATARAWTSFGRVLLNLDEFVTRP